MAVLNDHRPEKENIRNEGLLLQALMNHWFHEDRLFWSQIRHLLVLEFAVFAAMFSLKVSVLAVLVLILSAGIAAYFLYLSSVIRNNRDSNLHTIALVSRNVASDETLSELAKESGEEHVKKYGAICLAKHEIGGKKDVGGIFQRVVFRLAITINLILAVLISLSLFTGNNRWVNWLHEGFDHVVVKTESNNLHPGKSKD